MTPASASSSTSTPSLGRERSSSTRISQLVDANRMPHRQHHPLTRVVRHQYQSLRMEREQAAETSAEDVALDAIMLYEVEFPASTNAFSNGGSHSGSTRGLGLELETDFYGRHVVVKRVVDGSAASALRPPWLQPGHIVVAVNGVNVSALSFVDALKALRIAPEPRVIRFLDPDVVSVDRYRHERELLNRDRYGFAKDDRYILQYRRHQRKRQLTSYDHERRWAAFVQRHGGLDAIDRLFHKETQGSAVLPHRCAMFAQLRSLVRGGIPVVLRPRVWSLLAHVSPLRERFNSGFGSSSSSSSPSRYSSYYAQLVTRSAASPSLPDIDKDVKRTYPEHAFFQTVGGQRELRNVLGAYSVHNTRVGYCQSMNFLAGLLVLLMREEDAFWLLCAMLEPKFLPADNYTQSMEGTQTDQRVFQKLVAQELPHVAAHLELSGVQLPLVTMHWFLCAFACTLPTESTLRIWDWFFLDGHEVLFITALGLLKMAEPRLLATSSHAELHVLMKELGTDLHDEDELMRFLFSVARHDAGEGPGDREASADASGSARVSGSASHSEEDLDHDEHDEAAVNEDEESRTSSSLMAWVPRRLQRFVRPSHQVGTDASRAWSEPRSSGAVRIPSVVRGQARTEFHRRFTMVDIDRMRVEVRQEMKSSRKESASHNSH